MEMVSSTLEFVGLLTVTLYFGSPPARVAWARLRTRREDELESPRFTDTIDQR